MVVSFDFRRDSTGRARWRGYRMPRVSCRLKLVMGLGVAVALLLGVSALTAVGDQIRVQAGAPSVLMPAPLSPPATGPVAAIGPPLAATRPRDGVTFVVWSTPYTLGTPYVGDVTGQMLTQDGQLLGAPVRLDAGPATFDGYKRYELNGPQAVAYSPGSDSWLVVFGEALCSTEARCFDAEFVVHVGPDGAVLGEAAEFSFSPAEGGVALACRLSGCLASWGTSPDQPQSFV